MLVIGAAVASWKLGSVVWFIPLGLAGVAAGVSLAYGMHKLYLRLNGGAEKMAILRRGAAPAQGQATLPPPAHLPRAAMCERWLRFR